MTHYEAELVKRTESDLVLKNEDGLVIKTLATFYRHNGLCAKTAAMLNTMPEIVEALKAIEATKVHKIPGSYDDNGVWLVSAGAVRKCEKVLAKLREAS